MPINVSEMKSMQKEYGKKEGQKIYFATENKGGKAFDKGLKTAKAEGHTVKDFASYKKRYSTKAIDTAKEKA